MSIDSSLVNSLNSWGETHRTLVRVASNNLVYTVLLLAAVWLVAKILIAHPIKNGVKSFLSSLVVKGAIIFAIPAGIAIFISELISAVYVRQRPFVSLPQVQLLVPHTADGGMPSHHIVFMTTLVVSIYFYDKRFGTLLALLTLLSGIARVIAGIHYPSDIIVGAALGVGIVYLYRWALYKVVDQKYLLLI